MSNLAAIDSALSGREIKRLTVSAGVLRDAKIMAGVPEPMAEMLMGTWRAGRRDDLTAVDPTLGTFLGRRPETINAFLGKCSQHKPDMSDLGREHVPVLL